jgi:hypothetical protein
MTRTKKLPKNFERYWKKRVPSPLKDWDSPALELHPHFK